MKVKEKRKVRGYKITDSDYNRAMKRAAKEKGKLAKIIETMVIGYSRGYHIIMKNSVAP